MIFLLPRWDMLVPWRVFIPWDPWYLNEFLYLKIQRLVSTFIGESTNPFLWAGHPWCELPWCSRHAMMWSLFLGPRNGPFALGILAHRTSEDWAVGVWKITSKTQSIFLKFPLPCSEGDWILRAGDSSRDFLIPDGWRAPLEPFKSSRELTIPNKGHQQNCCCPVFFWFSIRKGSWRHERSGDELATHHNCFPTMWFLGGFPTGLRE